MSASYCFVLHGRCIAPRVRDSIFAEHQRPQVAAFMECVDFMQPRWPSRSQHLIRFSVGHFALAQGNPWEDIVRDSGSGKHSDRVSGIGRLQIRRRTLKRFTLLTNDWSA
jgi:hypothetical protein